MQIHELNSGTPAASDVIAMDTGSDTYKATADGLVPTFTSGDAASPTAWASVSTITSGLSLATLFNRISTMVKNVRWLYTVLGTTSISGIGNGTVTGAISALNGKIHYEDINFSYSFSAGGTIGTRADQYTEDPSYPNETILSVNILNPQNTDRANFVASYNTGTKKIYLNVYYATTGGSSGTCSVRVVYMK